MSSIWYTKVSGNHNKKTDVLSFSGS